MPAPEPPSVELPKFRMGLQSQGEPLIVFRNDGPVEVYGPDGEVIELTTRQLRTLFYKLALDVKAAGD